MLPGETQRRGEPSGAEAVVLRDLDFGLQPELGLTAGVLHVNVRLRLFAREEVEAESTNPQDRGTHVLRILQDDRAVNLRNRGASRRKIMGR